MNASVIQLLVLAAIALFLIFKLKEVLGTRSGFEKPPTLPEPLRRKGFEVIEGGPDSDITDHVEASSSAAQALIAMKKVDPSFNVTTFLQGARSAYEMILMAFERGDISPVRAFLEHDIETAFDAAIAARNAKGLSVDAQFIGLREMTLHDARFDAERQFAEITMRYVGELTWVVRDSTGQAVDGSEKDIKRQKDIWTFGRDMSSSDPNWQLIATGE